MPTTFEHRKAKRLGTLTASAQTTRRGRRTWHVRTLLVREPGDLMVGQHQHACCTGPRREGEEPQPMMYDHEKSDPAIVCAGQRMNQEG